ncbi:MAG TPA: hypothetical protein DCG19_01145, partial [Cryomorphaceae bacterium]|nr:hypothetical protein [Cryomorphaceae bacterium]
LRAYALRQGFNQSFQAHDYPGFKLLKRVGIAFQAGQSEKAVLDYARELRNKGKEVHLLGYIPKRRKDIEGIPSYPWLCKSDVNWLGVPKGKEVSDFLALHFGVYIEILDAQSHPLDFVSSRVAADFKIGFSTREELGFDLSLQMMEKSPAQSAFKEIDYYLNFINNKESKEQKI